MPLFSADSQTALKKSRAMSSSSETMSFSSLDLALDNMSAMALFFPAKWRISGFKEFM